LEISDSVRLDLRRHGAGARIRSAAMTRKPLPHDITLPEQEAYRGYDYWRPSDASVQSAVEMLILRHADEFQELIDEEELERIERARDEARIDAYEYEHEER
jgi:hypothetical protein